MRENLYNAEMNASQKSKQLYYRILKISLLNDENMNIINSQAILI